jgi:hypothetical protein
VFPRSLSVHQLPNAPPRVQFGAIIPRIDSHLDKISQAAPETYNGGSGYWDGTFARFHADACVETYTTLPDYCLAHFLRGVALSFAAYPVSPMG